MVSPSILLTGASGFLGSAVMAEAEARGLALRATSRHAVDWPADLGTDDLAPLPDGIDVVIHAAGRMEGTDGDHARDTIDPTRRLFEAAAGRRFVLISSLSVLGYAELMPGAQVDEDTPLEARPERRDAYARAKLAQEQIVVGSKTLILRPGAIYGPGRLRNGHLGVAKGPVLFRFGRAGEVPLIHVASAARAILDAALSDEIGVMHLVDNALPDRAGLAAMLARGGWPKVTVPVPWRVVKGLSSILRGPGLLTPEVLAARIMPLSYSNARAKAALPWVPERNHAAQISAAQALEGGA